MAGETAAAVRLRTDWAADSVGDLRFPNQTWIKNKERAMSSSTSAPALSSAQKSGDRVIPVTQIFVVTLLTLAMASYFWVDSRYPALLKKLHAGHSVKVSAPITFDAVLPVNPSMPLPVRIARTTGNWLYANRIGMSFGIGFGAALLTLLPMFTRRRFRSSAGNTLLGVA